MNTICRSVIRAGLAGLVLAFYLAVSAPTTLRIVRAASIPGTATVRGVVGYSKPFKAAQVYLYNPSRRMCYMVYTVGGRYQAMNLLPGDYEVSVKTKGLQDLESDTTKITVKTGQNATLNLTLHDASPGSPWTEWWREKNRGGGPSKVEIEYLPFDQIYPPGAGLAPLQKTCINCHGRNFLPAHHWNETQWNAAINMMMGVKGALAQGVMIQANEMSPADRDQAVKYLAEHFGPDSKTRAVKVNRDMPVDESKLAKAEYIEYWFPDDPPGKGVNNPEYAKLGPTKGQRMGQNEALDHEGNVWVADRGVPTRLVKIDPRTGAYKEYPMPNPKALIHDLNIDKDGIVWVPENEPFPPLSDPKLWGFDPKTEKWAFSYVLDPQHVIPKGTLKHPHALDFDSKGNIWIGYIVGNGLSKWDRETKEVSTYIVPTPNSYPYGLVVDKKDNVWIGELHAGKLAKFDTETSQFTEYVPPTTPALIRRLAVGSDGLTIWSGSFSSGTLFKLDQTTGKMTEWKVPTEISEPYDFMVEGKYVWFSDGGQGGALIRFDPDDQSFTFFPTPQIADLPKIYITKSGAIWYCPRSSPEHPGVGVFHPDMTKMTTLAAY